MKEQKKQEKLERTFQLTFKLFQHLRDLGNHFRIILLISHLNEHSDILILLLQLSKQLHRIF